MLKNNEYLKTMRKLCKKEKYSKVAETLHSAIKVALWVEPFVSVVIFLFASSHFKQIFAGGIILWCVLYIIRESLPDKEVREIGKPSLLISHQLAMYLNDLCMNKYNCAEITHKAATGMITDNGILIEVFQFAPIVPKGDEDKYVDIKTALAEATDEISKELSKYLETKISIFSIPRIRKQAYFDE